MWDWNKVANGRHLQTASPGEKILRQTGAEIEGVRKDGTVTRWAQFTDIKDIKQETLKRLELHFENWL